MKNYKGPHEVKSLINVIQDNLNRVEQSEKGMLSDDYCTFDELYEYRKIMSAALFNEWAMNGKYNVYKSYSNLVNGGVCEDGWFMVCAFLPAGQISFHYKKQDWKLFQVRIAIDPMEEFDGHTGKDILNRIANL